MTLTPLLPGATASLRFEAGYPIVLADVRKWARQLARPSQDVELVVTELLSNARDHGERGAISVSITRREHTATVVVSNSTRAEPPSIPTEAPPVDPDQVRGRGLAIASAVTEHLAVEQQGDTLIITGRVALD